MSVHALEIPAELPAIAGWLDAHLVGTSLGELVAELVAVRSTVAPEDDVSLERSLGTALPDVLERGVISADPAIPAVLLRSPTLLLELQERVLVDGGSYWDQIAAEVYGDDVLDHGWQILRTRLEPDPVGRPESRATRRPRRETGAIRTGRGRTWRIAALSSLLTAAAMLLAMVAWQRMGPPSAPAKPTGWGWNRPGALSANVRPADYLRGLATSADEWFNTEPATREELAARIVQFRHGCSTLLLSEHAPLAPVDREWLHGRCRLWADKLTASLTDLESGESVEAVRSDVDATIEKLVKALQDRARTV